MSYRPTGNWDKHDRYTYVRDNNLGSSDDDGYTYVSTGEKDSDGRPTYNRYYTGSYRPTSQNDEHYSSGSGETNWAGFFITLFIIAAILMSIVS